MYLNSIYLPELKGGSGERVHVGQVTLEFSAELNQLYHYGCNFFVR